MTLPCCTIDGSLLQTFVLAGEDAAQWITGAGPGLNRIEFLVPQISHPGAITDIEKGLSKLDGVTNVRVNLTGKRVAVIWRTGILEPQALLDRLAELGYGARPFDPREAGIAGDNRESAKLLRALAVAGFAAGNVMLLSVSIWSGAEAATRDLFHWLSAMIALPAVAYAGRPFFVSALNAVRQRSVNMDVPISLGVVLASAMSLFETVNHAEHAYFDAAVTLLFFLLAGRYLDQIMRSRARSAVAQLVSLAAEGATVVQADGTRRFFAARDLKPGMRIAIAAGDRVPADGIILKGTSDMHRAFLTGESAPETAVVGSKVHAGEVNLTAPLIAEVTAAGSDTFLAELVRLMLAAEQSQSKYIRLADRLARFYSPAVHLLALSTLIVWVALGQGWHASLMAAIAVLIITCPCALGLAVPAVQVVASGKLFRAGIMIKDGAALEKLSAIDTVIFDKTGTLTRGEPEFVSPRLVDTRLLSIAAGLAEASRHPLSRALLRHVDERGIAPAKIDNITEHPGLGLTGSYRGKPARLGSPSWCGFEPSANDDGYLAFAFKLGSQTPVLFQFQDQLRPEAAEMIQTLMARGLDIHLLSGDRETAVARVAKALGIEKVRARAAPDQKLAYVEALRNAGRKVLMVGDGINDAPALAAGFTSIAPASASDIGRTAAEMVFMGDSAAAIASAIAVASEAQWIAKGNFALAVAYNLFAVPLAMAGLVSPLIAAVAMSTSSILVVGNALRLGVSLKLAKVKLDRAASKDVTDSALEKAA